MEAASGEATTVNIALAPEAIGLEEVVVQARALRNTEAALLKERQKAAAVSDAISSEAISQSGSGVYVSRRGRLPAAGEFGTRRPADMSRFSLPLPGCPTTIGPRAEGAATH